MSLRKNILKNGVAKLFQKGVRILEQLFLVPFFITAWGADYYGEWLTLTIIPSILAFSDLGFGSAAANTFVLRYASDDRQGAANIGKTGFFILSVVICSGIIISIIALALLNHFHIFEKSLLKSHDAILAVACMMTARLLNFYQQLYDAYFRSARKASLSISLQSINSLCAIAGGFIVLQTGGTVVAFAVTILSITLVFNPVYIILAKKTLKLRELKTARIIKEDIRDTFKIGIGYLMSPVWQSIFFQGNTFIVRLLLGPSAVAVFNTVRTLSRSASQLFTIIYGSVFPELQYEIGQGNTAKAQKLFRISIFIVILLSLIGMLVLYWGGMWFYQIWTHKALQPPPAMWTIFIVGIGFNALWWTAEMVFQAVNRPYEFTIAGLIAACLSVGTTYLLAGKFGLVGAAAGSLVLEICLAFYVLPTSCRLIGQPIKSLFCDFLSKDFLFLKSSLTKKGFYPLSKQ